MKKFPKWPVAYFRKRDRDAGGDQNPQVGYEREQQQKVCNAHNQYLRPVMMLLGLKKVVEMSFGSEVPNQMMESCWMKRWLVGETELKIWGGV